MDGSLRLIVISVAIRVIQKMIHNNELRIKNIACENNKLFLSLMDKALPFNNLIQKIKKYN